MQKICRRCASTATARSSGRAETATLREQPVRDALATMRAKREKRIEENKTPGKPRIRDIVRARSTDFVSEYRHSLNIETTDRSHMSRVREAFEKAPTRQQLEIAGNWTESAHSSGITGDCIGSQSTNYQEEECSDHGQDDSTDVAVPLRLFPGDLVEYWPDNSDRRTALILRRPDEHSQSHYHIMDDRGKIRFANAIKFRFVLHEFYDVSRLPTDVRLMERDEYLSPIRRALKQFKSLADHLTKQKYSVLTNIYELLPTHLRQGQEPISSRDICEMVFGDATQAQLYATCEALLLDRLHFLPDEIQNMSVPMFLVRPPDFIEMVENVTSWTRAKSSQYKSFIKNAQSIARYGRTITRVVDGPLVGKEVPFEFSASDRLFINFMRQACLARTERGAPELYTSSLAPILKDLDLTSIRPFDRAAAYECLKLIGVIAPWEVNFNSLQSAALPGFNSSIVADEYASYEASTFGRNQVESLERLGLTDSSDSIRHDFKQLPVYAIDGDAALELDDGISIEEDWLHIHIADPASFISYGSKLADMVEFRGMTSYMANRAVPMLPWHLVEQHFSLGAKSPQPVMTTSIRLDASGEILEAKIRAAVVRNIKQLTYRGVDEIVFGHANSSKHDTITDVNWNTASASGKPVRVTSEIRDVDKQNIIRIADKLKYFRQYRLKHGAIDFVNVDKDFSVQPDDIPITSFNNLKPRFYSGRPGIRLTVGSDDLATDAQSLVAEAALLANHAVARFANENSIPLMYKVSENSLTDADRIKVASLRDAEGRVKFTELGETISRMQAGRTSLEHGPADTIGLPGGYTFSTSPLRRAWDMSTQWQLQSFLLKEPYKVDLNRFLPRCARREYAMKRIARSSANSWTVQLLHQMIERGQNPVLEAIVTRKHPNVKLPSQGHIASLNQKCQILREATDPELEVGTTVPVVIERLDMMDNVIFTRRIDA